MNSTTNDLGKVLLTGATGFVGSYLYPALVAAGCDVVCATRDVAKARRAHPGRQWVELDLEKPETLERALRDCDRVIYLVHGMGQAGDYSERESSSARNFASKAVAAGIKRVAYLGGVLPSGRRSSKHLESRKRTGEILRGTEVSTIELRAAMVIGEGSASWTMVRDLAARLPAMLLPRWLKNHSHPIGIDDVVYAILAALVHPRSDSFVLEIPGPERLSHRDLLMRIARLFGHERLMINVPVLSPRLSSYWIALVTRVDLSLAKELVEGVRFDLDPQDEILWQDHEPMAIEAAAKLAISDAQAVSIPSPNAIKRMTAIGEAFRDDSAADA